MTARWSSWKGNGVPDDDSVVADQDLLDQQSDHALTLDYVESFGRRAQTGEKRGQRFSETQIGGAVGRLVCDRLQLDSKSAASRILSWLRMTGPLVEPCVRSISGGGRQLVGFAGEFCRCSRIRAASADSNQNS